MERNREAELDTTQIKGCRYDADAAARKIASYIETYQHERDQQRESERFERFGRAIAGKLLYLAGAFCLYLVGRGHETVMGFFSWFVKSSG